MSRQDIIYWVMVAGLGETWKILNFFEFLQIKA